MSKLILPLALLVSTTGCIIYEDDMDRDCCTSTGGTSGGDGGGAHSGDVDTDTDADTDADTDTDTDPAPTYTLAFDPAGAVPGTTVIVSLIGEGDVDLTQVAEVDFYGQSSISVLAADVRSPSEYLMTISVAQDSALGSNDALIAWNNGDVKLVRDAFSIVSDASQIPGGDDGGDPTGGGDTGGGGGGGGGDTGGGSCP